MFRNTGHGDASTLYFKQALSVSSSWQLGLSETWLFACLRHFTQGSFSHGFSILPPQLWDTISCFMICSVSEGHLPTGLFSLENCIVTLCIRDLIESTRILLSKLWWDHHCGFHTLIVTASDKSMSPFPVGLCCWFTDTNCPQVL